jgi:uncharacterized protein with HEPN domain
VSSDRDWQFFVMDMAGAVDRIVERTDGASLEGLIEDRNLQESLAWNLHVLGEASSRVPEHIKEAYPDLPWSEVRTMRNRIVHVYFDIDPAILWDTATVDVPSLKPLLARVIAENPVSQ